MDTRFSFTQQLNLTDEGVAVSPRAPELQSSVHSGATKRALLSEELIETRARLLVDNCFNRRDIIAVQNPSTGKPLPVQPDNFEAAVLAHVGGPTATFKDAYHHKHWGRLRIGTYCPQPNGMTRFGVIDIDGGAKHAKPVLDAAAVALHIVQRAKKLGIKCYLERSGGGEGFHVWVFFEFPIHAAFVRTLMFDLAKGEFPLANGGFADPKRGHGLEVFPKQDQLTEGGLGNLVYLPYFHGSPNGCSEFVDENFRVLHLKEIEANPVRAIVPWAAKTKASALRLKPPRGKNVSTLPSGSGRYSDLRKIARLCVATRELMRQARRPSERGMSHIARRTLAQIAKSAGLSDERVAQLFRRQPNFNRDISLQQVRSLKCLPACRSIGADLGFCNGKCEAICSIKRGTPVAFLDTKVVVTPGGRDANS